MALDYTTLTTWAQCDDATKEIDFALLTFSARDINADVADERDGRTQADVAARLSKVNGEISSLDYRLAEPGLDAKALGDLTDEREDLVVQRKKLVKRNDQVTGTAQFMADVKGEQIDVQVTLLTTVKAGIVAHRATLSA
jgi:hypothetical protein